MRNLLSDSGLCRTETNIRPQSDVLNKNIKAVCVSDDVALCAGGEIIIICS